MKIILGQEYRLADIPHKIGPAFRKFIGEPVLVIDGPTDYDKYLVVCGKSQFVVDKEVLEEPVTI